MQIFSGCYLVWFRADRERDEIRHYWRSTHGQIANQIPAMQEYLQHHFSRDDHGFWPAPAGVGAEIPADWHMDGMTEIRFRSVWSALVSGLFHTRGIIRDEQNIFDRVLGLLSTPRGACWWTGPFRTGVGSRAVVFVRARHEFRGLRLHHFIHEQLAPALRSAGATELRTHVFPSGSHLLHRTPAVRHDQPPNRAYACAIVIGAEDRAALTDILRSPQVTATVDAQHRHCLAIHAYAVDHTYPLVLDGRPQTPAAPCQT